MTNPIHKHRILILGGTTEARLFAKAISDRPEFDITLSLAGRTLKPVPQSVPVRTGGFGGADGLAAYLRKSKTDILIDATHPYAQQISKNAHAAAEKVDVKFFAIRRPAWEEVPDDIWCELSSIEAAIDQAGSAPRRIFVALGRQELAPLERAPQHHYIIRSIDPVEPLPKLPNATYILARGPFKEAEEVALFEAHKIDLIIAKNSGGDATYAKFIAARALSVPVNLVERPPHPGGASAADVESALEFLGHLTASGSRPDTDSDTGPDQERGV